MSETDDVIIYSVIDDPTIEIPEAEPIIEPESIYLNFTGNLGTFIEDASGGDIESDAEIFEVTSEIEEPVEVVDPTAKLEQDVSELQQRFDDEEIIRGDTYISIAESRENVQQAMDEVALAMEELEVAMGEATTARAEAATALAEAATARTEASTALSEAGTAQTNASTALVDAATAKADALAAHNAAMDSSAQAALADGRYTVSSINPTSGDATGKPEGAVWEVRSGGQALRRFVLDAGSWTPIAITGEFIADLSIGTSKIADLAVTNAKINALNVDKLVVEGGANISSAVVGNLMAQNAFLDNLFAKSIVVGSLENPVMNSGFEAGTFQGWTTTGTWQTSSGAPEGQYMATCIPGAAETVSLQSNSWAVAAGDEWVVTGQFKNSLGGAASVSLGIKTNLATNVISVPASVTSWTQYSFSLTLPAGATNMSVWVAAVGGSGAGSVQVDNLVALKKVGTTVISDGAITTDKIQANAVVAEKIQANAVIAEKIQAGAVIAEKIQTNAVTSDKIIANAVTSDKIAANAVTAAKILAGEIKTTHMAAGTIDVDRLNADTFVGKVIKGATIISESSDGLSNITLGNQTLTINRDDGDGSSLPSLVLGGSTADRLVLRDSNGGAIHGLYSSGNAFIKNQLTVKKLVIDGDRFAEDIIKPRPVGALAIMSSAASWHSAGSSEIGVAALSDEIIIPRIYRLHFSAQVAPDTADDQLAIGLRVRKSSLGPPLYNSSEITRKFFTLGPGGWQTVHMEVVWQANANGEYGFIFTAKNNSANRRIRINSPRAYLEDIGLESNSSTTSFSLGGGTPYESSGSPPVSPPRSYTKTYDATWTRSWRGITIVDDFLHHGYYGGYQRYSMAGFGGTIASDLSGATITKAEVYLSNEHWYNGSGGTARIGAAGHTSAPASPITSGSVVTSGSWARGEDRWVDITTLANTSTRAITLGVGAGTAAANYGKFSNSPVRLRISYTK